MTVKVKRILKSSCYYIRFGNHKNGFFFLKVFVIKHKCLLIPTHQYVGYPPFFVENLCQIVLLFFPQRSIRPTLLSFFLCGFLRIFCLQSFVYLFILVEYNYGLLGLNKVCVVQ